MPGTSRSGGSRELHTDRTKADGGPKQPEGLTAAAKNKWVEVLSQLPTESLRRIDTHQLRLLSELLAQADALAQAIDDDQCNAQARRLFLATVDRVAKLSASFGLSPLDRQRAKLELAPVKDAEEVAFEKWLARGKAGA